MILTMGFTGEKALKFKQDFVDAFEAMEAELQKRQSPFEIPRTLSEALQLAADQAPKVEALNVLSKLLA